MWITPCHCLSFQSSNSKYSSIPSQSMMSLIAIGTNQGLCIIENSAKSSKDLLENMQAEGNPRRQEDTHDCKIDIELTHRYEMLTRK